MASGAFDRFTGSIDLASPNRLGVVGPGRLELPTSRLSGVRSNHLSYGPLPAAAVINTVRHP